MINRTTCLTWGDNTILINRIPFGYKICSLWCVSWVWRLTSYSSYKCWSSMKVRMDTATSSTRITRSVRSIMHWVISILISGHFFFRFNGNQWRCPPLVGFETFAYTGKLRPPKTLCNCSFMLHMTNLLS